MSRNCKWSVTATGTPDLSGWPQHDLSACRINPAFHSQGDIILGSSAKLHAFAQTIPCQTADAVKYSPSHESGQIQVGEPGFLQGDFDYTTAQGPSSNQTPSLKSVAEAEPSELFAFKECQDLLRTRLTGPMLRLIPQLTGLRLHVLWHRPMDFQGPGEMPVLCPRARQRAGAKGRQPNPDMRCPACSVVGNPPCPRPTKAGGSSGSVAPPTSVPAFMWTRSALSRWSCRREERLVFLIP